MKKYYFNLVAIDIIDSIDDKFYVIDMNGLIGVQSILKYQNIFHSKLRNLFGDDYSLECHSDFVKDFELLNLGLNKNSTVVIQNNGFSNENKLEWRKKYNFSAPPINSDIKITNHSDYPNFLIKPVNSYGGMGIKLYNQSTLIYTKKDYFIEQYLPSKLIDSHCYHSRLIIIHNEYETFPILHLNKLCPNPIIRNLNEGLLTEEESLSYISNKVDLTNPNFNVEKKEKWQLNTDKKFEKFCLDLVDEIKSKSISYNPNYLEEIKKSYSDKIDMINFLKNF